MERMTENYYRRLHLDDLSIQTVTEADSLGDFLFFLTGYEPTYCSNNKRKGEMFKPFITGHERVTHMEARVSVIVLVANF